MDAGILHAQAQGGVGRDGLRSVAVVEAAAQEHDVRDAVLQAQARHQRPGKQIVHLRARGQTGDGIGAAGTHDTRLGVVVAAIVDGGSHVVHRETRLEAVFLILQRNVGAEGGCLGFLRQRGAHITERQAGGKTVGNLIGGAQPDGHFHRGEGTLRAAVRGDDRILRISEILELQPDGQFVRHPVVTGGGNDVDRGGLGLPAAITYGHVHRGTAQGGRRDVVLQGIGIRRAGDAGSGQRSACGIGIDIQESDPLRLQGKGRGQYRKEGKDPFHSFSRVLRSTF